MSAQQRARRNLSGAADDNGPVQSGRSSAGDGNQHPLAQQRFDVLLAELRTAFSSQLQHADQSGFDRAAGISALRALLGISTPSVVQGNALHNFASDWPEELQHQVAVVLMDFGSKSAINQDLLRAVVDANQVVRSFGWLGNVWAALAALAGWPAPPRSASEQPPPSPGQHPLEGPPNRPDQQPRPQQRKTARQDTATSFYKSTTATQKT